MKYKIVKIESLKKGDKFWKKLTPEDQIAFTLVKLPQGFYPGTAIDERGYYTIQVSGSLNVFIEDK